MTVELRSAPHALGRALAAMVLVMAAATAGHTWAGGGLPAWPELVALAAILFTTSVLFLRHGVSFRVLLPAVGLAQAGLHTAFAALTPPGHHGGPHPATSLSEGSSWSWQMLLAHAVGTAAAALVWHCCERLAEVVLAPYAGRWAVLVEWRASVAADGVVEVLPGRLHLLRAPRRGPPRVPSVVA